MQPVRNRRPSKYPAHGLRSNRWGAWRRTWGELLGLTGGPPQLTPVLAPRVLEPRRLLDGAGPVMALDAVVQQSDYVEAAPLAPSGGEEQIQQVAAAPIANTDPSNVHAFITPSVLENGTAQLLIGFDDPDAPDVHTIAVDWGDGGPVESFVIPTGTRSALRFHTYLDDSPSGTSFDVAHVTVRVTDAAGGFAEGAANVRIDNVAPAGVVLGPITPIDENGFASLNLQFTDPGTLDTHQVEIDWGDGSPLQTIAAAPGARTLLATHQYLDDNPTGTPQDVYNVKVRVLDDDGGVSSTATALATVNNVAPFAPMFFSGATIAENGAANLQLAFLDPGTVDVHTVEINWGDGSPLQTVSVPVGARVVNLSHQYLDDNPTGTPSDLYNVTAVVKDDDGGVSTTATTIVQVNNVAPANLAIAPIVAIDEGGTAVLNLSFDDPGTLDGHTVEVDWGDGTPVETVAVAAGARTFTRGHVYVDDDPSGTSQDEYLVKVRVLDDDGGIAAGETKALVRNVAPVAISLQPAPVIFENDTATLELSFTDAGIADGHSVEIDWGDGSPLETVAAPTGGAGMVTLTHLYRDDNPSGTMVDDYTVTAVVKDDDGGVSNAVQTIVRVRDVAPQNLAISVTPTLNENGTATLHVSFEDPGLDDVHSVLVNWGDGSPTESFVLPVGDRSFTLTHQYLDDDPTGTPADTYTIAVAVADDDAQGVLGFTQTTVVNLPPTGAVVAVAPGSEGGLFTADVTFADEGTLDSHVVEVDWGDGLVSTGSATMHAFSANHVYADDGVYTVKVRITDDDGGETTAVTTVAVANVAPMLNVVGNQVIAEGSPLTLANIGTFTDPGFNNPLNVNDPGNGGEVAESFTYQINWGDGTPIDVGSAAIDTPGSAGVATAGSFDGAHTYADDGVYTVKVTVFDDDGGMDMRTFTVTVTNVNPTLTPIADQTIVEGSLLSLVNIGEFTDPGFNNPLNVNDPANGGEVEETFTYEINWGDGLPPDFGFAAVDQLGGVGVPTRGSFDGQHTYADNGVYTVELRVLDDDGGLAVRTFTVTVANVDPTLTPIADQTIAEGSLLSLTDIGTFTDPGFNNPLNVSDPGNGSEVVETFTFEINWGDGKPVDMGTAAIDQLGSVGVLTRGSFDGQHTYADNGVYTVELRVLDDDGGLAVRTFTVTVTNVDPVLTGTAGLTADEGHAVTLAGLGVGLTDPGFDNADNAPNLANGGEFEETFTGVSVDWGDGTPLDALTVFPRANGSAGVPTTAGFFRAPHIYADDGTYTVTLRLADDDGPVVSRTFTIVVHNVDPELELTTGVFVINEGQTLTINDLAKFKDFGFDNFANQGNASNGGEFEETFSYTIDWGDMTPLDAFDVTNRTSGSPGTKTTGEFGGSHFYADNDADNKYTVTVTLYDDDGGKDVQTIEVTVLNVNPTLAPIAATDLSSGGETTLNLTFADPGADSFRILVDWGDKLSLPLQDRFVIETLHDGPTPKSFTLVHKYDGPPDPLNPAADITIRVKIYDDDFGNPIVMAIGQSNVEQVVISNPGTGNQFFYVQLTEPPPRLEFAPRTDAGAPPPPQAGAAQTRTTFDQRGSAGEAKVGAERFFELRVINPDGSQTEGIRLPDDAINDLPGLFRNLPDNHYAIYLIQPQTGSRRLVIEVFVRNGKLIDPGDDSEGARDRPPTDDAARPGAEPPSPPEDAAAAPAAGQTLAPVPAAGLLSTGDPRGGGESLPQESAPPLNRASRFLLSAAGLALTSKARDVFVKRPAGDDDSRRQQLNDAARTGKPRRPR